MNKLQFFNLGRIAVRISGRDYHGRNALTWQECTSWDHRAQVLRETQDKKNREDEKTIRMHLEQIAGPFQAPRPPEPQILRVMAMNADVRRLSWILYQLKQERVPRTSNLYAHLMLAMRVKGISPASRMDLYREFRSDDSVTMDVQSLSTIADHMGVASDLEVIKQVEEDAKRLPSSDLNRLRSCLLSAYSRAGSASDCMRLFRVLEGCSAASELDYSSILMALSLAGEYHQATGVFEKVLSKGINVNIHMMNALLHMHSRRGEHDSFLEVMNKIAKMAEEPTRESYRILMRHWFSRKDYGRVLSAYDQMTRRNPRWAEDEDSLSMRATALAELGDPLTAIRLSARTSGKVSKLVLDGPVKVLDRELARNSAFDRKQRVLASALSALTRGAR